MPGKALPLLLLGGAAVVLAGGKKKKKVNGVKPKGELPDVEPDEPEPKKPGVAKPSVPKPTPKPKPEPSLPAPDKPLRPLGPTGVGSCANSIYRRDVVYIDPAVSDRLSQGALNAYNEAGYYFYIRHEAQEEIFDLGLKTFASMAAKSTAPTLRSVILREILSEINNECNWNEPTSEFDGPMEHVWDDGIRLMVLAQMMAGYNDPHPDHLFKTGKRYTMPRAPLGMNDPGAAGVKMDQRVEIIATDKSLQNAEHLFGRVSKLSGPNGESDRFEIRIVPEFQNRHVVPKRTEKHGFKQSSNAYFSKMSPTGIYRFYAPGVT